MESKPINAEVLRNIDSLYALQDDYDCDGSVAPNGDTLDKAEKVVKALSTLGQKVYCVAPGPSGEIMIDCRNGERSAEILLYAQKQEVVVYFPDDDQPLQGAFCIDDVPLIVNWLANN